MALGAARLPPITRPHGPLLAKLEQDKASLALSRAEDPALCENFALSVFARADRADRGGRADKATAVTFYAASYFFDVRREARRRAEAGGGRRRWWF